ncbi:MAG: hypothetical protein KTR31_17125 [Myxococcales bacterium]|nr:hypothetical protein [Myxococcales bacterium]
MRPIVSLILLVGCGPSLEISEYARSTHPPASVESEAELDGNRRDFQGTVTVSGDNDEGWDLAVATISSGREDVSVRSPSRPDLSILASKAETVQVSLAEDPLTDRLSLMVSDDDGPIYLLEPIAPTILSSSGFSPQFVQQESDIGTSPVANTTLNLTSVTVATDSGEVEAFPGVPVEVEIDDLFYRFVLLASWDRFIEPGVGVNCSLDDMFAYELIRVERGTTNTDPIERPEGQDIDGGACLSAQ